MSEENDTASAHGGVQRRSLAYLSTFLDRFADPSYTPREALEDDPLSPLWVANEVDVACFSAWTLVGLELFSGKLPSLHEVSVAARRVVLFAARERYAGNITWMAKALNTSRRSLREYLKKAGLYTPS